MSTEGQPVKFRDCTCPGTPHDGRDGADDGDRVWMRPALGFAAGAEALRLMRRSIEVSGIDANGKPIITLDRLDELVGPVYVREGVMAWNIVDEEGPVPLDTSILVENFTWAYPIAEAGDDLYSAVVMAPLVKEMSAPSRNGQNGKPTRQTRRSSQKARSPRKPSSRNGSGGRLSPVNP